MFAPGAEHIQLGGYVQAIGWTCPVKTVSAVPKTSEIVRKLIFNEFWRRTNIIYICVANEQVLKNKTYIYGLRPLES
jgi:hypothetical protein